MGFQQHARRALAGAAYHARRAAAAVDRGITHVARATVHAAQAVDQAVTTARPIYAGARPILHHLGVDTSGADRVLNQYEGIRRAVTGGR